MYITSFIPFRFKGGNICTFYFSENTALLFSEFTAHLFSGNSYGKNYTYNVFNCYIG